MFNIVYLIHAKDGGLIGTPHPIAVLGLPVAFGEASNHAAYVATLSFNDTNSLFLTSGKPSTT